MTARLSDLLRQRPFLRLPVTIVLFLAACDRTPEVGYTTVDTLETGVVLARNGVQGLWDEQSAWRLVHDVTVGTREGTGPEAFGLVSDFDTDRLGRVYVVDLLAQHIRVFDGDGAHVRNIGGPGSGPGEFKGVNGMTFDPSGRLWVMNQGNVRYSVFDTSGALLQEPRRPTLANQADWSPVFSRAGDLYDKVYGETMGASVRYDTITNQFVDSIPYPVLPEGTPFGWRHRIRTRGGWWLAVASEYRLHQTTPEGDTIRIVERMHERVRLTEAERDSALPPGVDPRQRSRLVGDPGTPRYRRVFVRIMIDEEDNLWVMLARQPNVDTTMFDVFDPEGRYLGAVTAPYRVESLPPPVIRGDKIVFLTKDDLDVPFVTMMEVVK